MASLRQTLLRHCRFATLLVVLALCLKAVMPAGYMAVSEGGRITITVCHGADTTVSEIAIPMKETGKADSHAGDGVVCPYSALAQGNVDGVDPLLLAGAILFVLLLGFSPVAVPALRPESFRTPPLRGPPLTV